MFYHRSGQCTLGCMCLSMHLECSSIQRSHPLPIRSQCIPIVGLEDCWLGRWGEVQGVRATRVCPEIETHTGVVVFCALIVFVCFTYTLPPLDGPVDMLRCSPEPGFQNLKDLNRSSFLTGEVQNCARGCVDYRILKTRAQQTWNAT